MATRMTTGVAYAGGLGAGISKGLESTAGVGAKIAGAVSLGVSTAAKGKETVDKVKRGDIPGAVGSGLETASGLVGAVAQPMQDPTKGTMEGVALGGAALGGTINTFVADPLQRSKATQNPTLAPTPQTPSQSAPTQQSTTSPPASPVPPGQSQTPTGATPGATPSATAPPTKPTTPPPAAKKARK